MRRWMARLAYSFFVLTLVFAWEGYRTQRGDRGPDQHVKMYAFYAAAAVCFGLALRGLRERHRLDEQEPSDPYIEGDENFPRR